MFALNRPAEMLPVALNVMIIAAEVYAMSAITSAPSLSRSEQMPFLGSPPPIDEAAMVHVQVPAVES